MASERGRDRDVVEGGSIPKPARGSAGGLMERERARAGAQHVAMPVIRCAGLGVVAGVLELHVQIAQRVARVLGGEQRAERVENRSAVVGWEVNATDHKAGSRAPTLHHHFVATAREKAAV